MTMIRIDKISDDAIRVSPTEHLGSSQFGAYLDACRRAGAHYDPTLGSQRCKVDALRDVIAELRSAGFEPSVSADMSDDIEKMNASGRSRSEAAEIRLSEMQARFAKAGLSLFPYQQDGLRWLSTRRTGLLGDAMGLGKTIQLLAALEDGGRAVVVCPAVVKGVWQREAARWRPDYRVTVLSGRGSFRWPEKGEIVVTNADILPRVEKEGRAYKLPDHLLVSCPTNVQVIGDEVHYFKNPRANRTRSMKAICRLAQKTGGRTWGATGTPLLNRPAELWAILEVFGCSVEAFGSWVEFCRLFNASRGRFGMDWGRPSSEVPTKLRKVMLRREREEVLKDLPEKTFQQVNVTIDRETMALCDELKARLDESGIDLESETLLADMMKDDVVFEMLSRVRAALATAKIPAVSELLDEFESEGETVILASAHKAPLKLAAEREGWALITGDVPPHVRTQIEDDFQAGKLKGIALGIKSGGVGITLTHAHQMVFVDLDWTPGNNEQCEDRICRIGQDRGCIYTLVQADHFIDALVNEKLSEKRFLFNTTIRAAAVSKVQIDDAPIEVKTHTQPHRKSNDAGIDCTPIVEMFKKADEAGIQYPRITWENADTTSDDGVEIRRLRLQLVRSGRNAGAINVTDGRPYGASTWYGRITTEGRFEMSGNCDDFVREEIEEMADDPVEACGTFGRTSGNCCFCAQTLTDERSKSVGYGPICAGKFGLPWGEVTA